MTAWCVRGVELPFGDRTRSWWVHDSGRLEHLPIAGAEQLPGRYVLTGLVDAHAHPAIGAGPSGPVPLSEQQTRANLVSWAETGVTLIRDVGSPGGLTLDLSPAPGEPDVRAAGRFLAPKDRYFEELLIEPVGESDLLDAALKEIQRGASWVKVVGDFPRVPEFVDTARTYPIELIERLCVTVHSASARVAIHTTLPDVAPLVEAGVDSIEHGTGLDERALEEMGRRGVAWIPTLCATFAASTDADAPPGSRERSQEVRSRFAELLPFAVRRGVPVLTGTDVVGSIAREVTLLTELGLEPAQSLAAASDWGRSFLGEVSGRADLVTYDHDPRDDPAQLDHPAAVLVAGTRVR